MGGVIWPARALCLLLPSSNTNSGRTRFAATTAAYLLRREKLQADILPCEAASPSDVLPQIGVVGQMKDAGSGLTSSP
ncbi:hypothetical protein K458DRAFT_414947 [Lentithecium fluviatile CBS 122367]|uniref:Uncharacterized protein n=1 Tax=Lentithecium fluviatile CBS 122367 TaxID=1168545 RepID=A0A6G1JCD6_9PLEO|nr:hypothetical protein K458DRAFT_414947 [Lentithecium fluviatile CBS 122367]